MTLRYKRQFCPDLSFVAVLGMLPIVAMITDQAPNGWLCCSAILVLIPRSLYEIQVGTTRWIGYITPPYWIGAAFVSWLIPCRITRWLPGWEVWKAATDCVDAATILGSESICSQKKYESV